MPADSTRCPKCKGEMEPGFLTDTRHHNVLQAAEWIEGAPERSFWGGLKTKGRDRFTIRSNRCRECGYLESYARSG